MKIFLNLIAAKQGGQITRALEFLNNFNKIRNINDELILIVNTKLKKKIIKRKNIKIINIKFIFNSHNFLLRFFWENTFQFKLLKQIKPDVYLTFSHYLPLFNLKIPSVVLVSNLAPFSNFSYDNIRENWVNKIRLKILKKTILSSVKKSTVTLALSQFCKKVLIKNGINKSKIFVTYNGVNQNKMGNLNKLFIKRYSSNNKYILSVSHFYRYKNFEQLINAYNLLPVPVKKKYHLKIIGIFNDFKYVNEIKILIKKLNLKKKIQIIPGLDKKKLNNYYRDASLFVFTSKIENSPNILLEAMSYAQPIISSNNAPMPEFGDDNVFYFKKKDYSELAKKIEKILLSKVIAKRLMKKSITRSKYFSWKIFTDKVLNNCRLVINSKKYR